jgi:hypothetical protein
MKEVCVGRGEDGMCLEVWEDAANFGNGKDCGGFYFRERGSEGRRGVSVIGTCVSGLDVVEQRMESKVIMGVGRGRDEGILESEIVERLSAFCEECLIGGADAIKDL